MPARARGLVGGLTNRSGYRLSFDHQFVLLNWYSLRIGRNGRVCAGNRGVGERGVRQGLKARCVSWSVGVPGADQPDQPDQR